MTKEEAIEVIEQDIPCEHDRDLIAALDMAISALSENKGNEVAEVIEGVLDKIAGVPYHFWDSEAVVYLADVISAVEDCKKGGYYDHGGVIGKAIQNGIPLDDVKVAIDEQYDRIRPYNIDVAEGLEMALGILDNIGKAESEDKE